MHKLLTLAAAAALAGCASAPPHETYDTIKTQMAAAVKPAPPAPSDEAVANALLPPATTLATQMPKAREALEERFNVSFNNVPAQQFFNSLVVGTRYNMLVSPEVTGTISANLKDVTLPEALDAIRELYGYDYKIDGTKVYIRPLTLQSRMFRVNYLVGQRQGQSSLRVNSTSVSTGYTGSGQPGATNQFANALNTGAGQSGIPGQVGMPGQQMDAANVITTLKSDFWKELKEALEALVDIKAAGRSVVISPQSGVIVVRAMPAELRNIEQYLKATQVAVERQVILEAKILEVELNDSYQSGINWSSFASFRSSHDNRVSGGFVSPGTTLSALPFGGGQPPEMTNGIVSGSAGFNLKAPDTSPGSLFGLVFQTSNFAALISFLESQGTVHVLSSPRVTAMNNEKAVLKIGTDEFFVTGVTTTNTTSTTSNQTTPSVTLQPFFSGVVLDVTPQIDEDGNILLHVHPSVSQVSTVTKTLSLGTAGTLTLPLAASATSEIDSMVRGQNGRVVAIGGLMRQAATGDTNQVPGAGNVPILGALFRNKSQVLQKRELVVLIKPTIVDDAASWNEEISSAQRRIEQLDPRQRERR